MFPLKKQVRVGKAFVIYTLNYVFKTLTRLDNGRTFHRALALGLSSELPTLCLQLARRSTAAKLCHNQVHMTAALTPCFQRYNYNIECTIDYFGYMHMANY